MEEEKKLNKAGDRRGMSKGGGKGNKNSWLSKIELDVEPTKQIMKEILHNANKKPVKSDKECEERLAEYFLWCAEHGVRPTVEEMALAVGYSASTLWDWENGRSQSAYRSELVKKAKALIQTFDAKAVIQGGLNPLVYFFRAKNYYGMKDQQDIVVSPSQTPLGDEVNAEELKKKLDTNKIIDVDDFMVIENDEIKPE